MATLVELKLIAGSNNHLHPQKIATRAEAATVLHRIIDLALTKTKK